MNSSATAIIIVAGGRGSRAGPGAPKQYRPLAGRPVLAHTIESFAAALPDAPILTVIHVDDVDAYQSAIATLTPKARALLQPPTTGGASRQQSVAAGLEALQAHNPAIVLIHDAARPFATKALIARAQAAALAHKAAVPGLAVTDTIKSVDAAQIVSGTPERATLRAIQTPQAFEYRLILEAHRAAKGRELTDDGAVAELAGHPVHVFAGDAGNMKITEVDDLARAERKLLGDLPDIRTGQGFDVHAFGPGDHVWLGGLAIPHTHGLVGHSDADVLSHTITDAIFGGLSEGDIGSHFPPSDPQWKGADSSIFLAYAANRVRERGGMIAHVDATLICERPKLTLHRDAIRERLAQIMGISIGRVALKATTTERLGFAGREEGIAAMATVTVRLPAGKD